MQHMDGAVQQQGSAKEQPAEEAIVRQVNRKVQKPMGN